MVTCLPFPWQLGEQPAAYSPTSFIIYCELKAMSCCFPCKLLSRQPNREDCYKVKETEEGAVKQEGEPPKYSWERREKVDPADYTIQNVHNTTLKKEKTKDGGPLQIENCTDSAILFLHQTSQVIIDDCRHCTIVLGPSEGSVFIRDSSNCTILTSCQQLRTRDCTSVRIGILCPTEPIVENSNDIQFFHLAMKYPQLKDQMNAVGLRPFTNRVTSVHDFTPAGANGRGNFKISAEPAPVSEGQQELLRAMGVVLKPTADDFIPRFTEVSDKNPEFLYISGKSEPVDELGDRAIELLHAIYKADMKIMATYDISTKSVDSKLLPFVGQADRIIIFQLSGNLANLECDVQFDVMADGGTEPLQQLLNQIDGKKSG